MSQLYSAGKGKVLSLLGANYKVKSKVEKKDVLIKRNGRLCTGLRAKCNNKGRARRPLLDFITILMTRHFFLNAVTGEGDFTSIKSQKNRWC